MDKMACNSCAKPFSLLRKEKGCPRCGFSYCSKCLNNKIFVPKLNAEGKVCSKCKNAANTNESKNVVVAPDAYYRRIGAIADKNMISQTAESNDNKEDQHIYDRLKKLKEKNIEPSTVTDDDIKNRLNNIKGQTPTTSNAEIEARLAKLRGVPIDNITGKPVLQPPDTRSEQEQADDLLKQYMAQTNIDNKYKDEFDGLIQNLESRVQRLKGTSTKPTLSKEKSIDNTESEDEEETIRKIVNKVKAEASQENEDNTFPTTSDELPFCEICNEDAIMRCLGCKYLFCKRCFNEHKDDDDGCNRYELYEAPKKFN